MKASELKQIISKLLKEAKAPENKKKDGKAKVKNPGPYMGGARQKAGIDDDGDGIPNKVDSDPQDGSKGKKTKSKKKKSKSKTTKESKTMTTKITKEYLKETIKTILENEFTNEETGDEKSSELEERAGSLAAAKLLGGLKGTKAVEKLAMKISNFKGGKSLGYNAADVLKSLREQEKGDGPFTKLHKIAMGLEKINSDMVNRKKGPDATKTAQMLKILPTFAPAAKEALKKLPKNKKDKRLVPLIKRMADFKRDAGERSKLSIDPDRHAQTAVSTALTDAIKLLRNISRSDSAMGQASKELGGKDYYADQGPQVDVGAPETVAPIQTGAPRTDEVNLPEGESALYESRFTPRNNRLFDKLLKEWTK